MATKDTKSAMQNRRRGRFAEARCYPASVLRDARTGKPIMLKRTKNSAEIRRMAREGARQLIKALNDPTGLTPI
jgi:CTP:molybdopterin cytidylyltransferase MocA